MKLVQRGLPKALSAGAVTVLCAALLMGCGDDADDGAAADPSASGTSETVAAEELDGRSFVADEVSGHDLVEGTTVRVSFEDGMAVNAGCNTMFGAYTVESEDGAAVIRWEDEPGATMMGCVGGLADQDTWLAELFADGVTVEPAEDGGEADLILTAGDVRMDFAEVGDGNAPADSSPDAFGARINGPTTAQPGEVLKLTLTNTGSRRDSFKITVSPADAGKVGPRYFTLRSGRSAKFRLKATTTPLSLKVESVGAGGYVDAYTVR